MFCDLAEQFNICMGQPYKVAILCETEEIAVRERETRDEIELHTPISS